MELELTGQGAARHPPPARRVRLQAAARAHPAPRARCRRRLRHEELPLSRMGAAAVGGAQARPAGALARRARGGVRDGAQGRDIAATAKLALDGTAASWRSTWRWWPTGRLSLGATGRAPRPSPRRRRRAASTTFPRSRSTCAAPSPTPCRSMPIAAPASPRPTTSIERAIEAAARELGRDPAELRRQNLIAAFPHKTAMGMAIDFGGFVANLDAAVARAERRASRRGAPRPRRAAGCAASASAASSKPRAARPTRAPRCASRATAR